MGQYHKVVNLDKNFFYSPKSIANGVKSMEQGYSYNSCLALTSLLSEGWNGERVFLIGDYAEANDVNGVEDATDLYNAKMRNVGWLARTIVEKHSNIVFEKSEYKIRNLDHTYRTISYYVSNYGDGIKTIGLDDTTEMRIVNYDSKEMLSVGPNGEGGSLHNIAEKGWDNGIMTILIILAAGNAPVRMFLLHHPLQATLAFRVQHLPPVQAVRDDYPALSVLKAVADAAIAETSGQLELMIADVSRGAGRDRGGAAGTGGPVVGKLTLVALIVLLVVVAPRLFAGVLAWTSGGASVLFPLALAGFGAYFIGSRWYASKKAELTREGVEAALADLESDAAGVIEEWYLVDDTKGIGTLLERAYADGLDAAAELGQSRRNVVDAIDGALANGHAALEAVESVGAVETVGSGAVGYCERLARIDAADRAYLQLRFYRRALEARD